MLFVNVLLVSVIYGNDLFAGRLVS